MDSSKYNSGTLNAANDAVIGFSRAASVEGVSGKFIDGGYTLTADSKIAIGEDDAAPSADGLTAGYYNWNSTKNAFEKQIITIEKQPQDVTVTEGAITQSLSVTASASNAGTISYHGGMIILSPARLMPSIRFPTNLTAGTYEYYCDITAPGCMQTNTRTATVTVNPAGGASTYAVTVNNGTASLSTASGRCKCYYNRRHRTKWQTLQGVGGGQRRRSPCQCTGIQHHLYHACKRCRGYGNL